MFRFVVKPEGRRFGHRGEVVASHPKTGLLEIEDADFAERLRVLSKTDMIRELTDGEVVPGHERPARPVLPPAPAGVWRFRVEPPGRRFSWHGTMVASDRQTGLLEIPHPEFARSIMARIGIDTIFPWVDAAVPAPPPPGTKTVLEFPPHAPPDGAHPTEAPTLIQGEEQDDGQQEGEGTVDHDSGQGGPGIQGGGLQGVAEGRPAQVGVRKRWK